MRIILTKGLWPLVIVVNICKANIYLLCSLGQGPRDLGPSTNYTTPKGQRPLGLVISYTGAYGPRIVVINICCANIYLVRPKGP